MDATWKCGMVDDDGYILKECTYSEIIIVKVLRMKIPYCYISHLVVIVLGSN